MPQITDPDGLSQGGSTSVAATTFASQAGAVITITSVNVPAVTVNDFIEVRDAANPVNDGLYEVTTYNAGVSIVATKQALTGAVVNPANDAGSATIRILGTNANEKNIHFDTSNLVFTFLNGFGSVTVLDNNGVVGQVLYSFMKEEWKNDNDLIKFPFPMTAITPEQFEFNTWRPVDEVESTISTTNPSNTQQLLRTAGWSEVDVNGFIDDLYFGWVTLGNIDASDFAYGFFDSATVDADITDAVFDGAVNEAVRAVARSDLSGAGTIAFVDGGGGDDTLTRTTGSWVTDGYLVGDSVFIQNAEDSGNNGSFVLTSVSATDLGVATASFTANADDTTAIIAIDRRANVFTPRIRVFGKTYGQSSTTEIGVTTLTNQVYRFPLSEATDAVVSDLGVSEANADGGAAPYDDMSIAYFLAGQSRDGFNAGDGKLFGVIVDGDISVGQVDGGGVASAEQIYAFVQARLRNATDINDGAGGAAGDVIGRLAEPLLAIASTGNTLSSLLQSTNPGGDGNGVYIDSFSSLDKNRVAFRDNSNVLQTFPLTVTVSINFNPNLENDVDAVFTMFFTNNDAGDDDGSDYGTINAIIVQDDAPANISGSVSAAQLNFNYAYDQNVQRGTGSDSTPAPVTIVALGLSLAQFVVATGTITTAGLTASLVAALERNYSNPV